MIHVPYRGAVPAMTDIMASQIDIYYATETSGGAHMKAGRMKPLVVTTENRMAAFPDLKTLQSTDTGNRRSASGTGCLGHRESRRRFSAGCRPS